MSTTGVFRVEKHEDDEITSDMISEAAKLFSNNYGVWGPQAAEKIGPFAKPGARVKMSARKLREQVLPVHANNIYIRALSIEGDEAHLAGNVFGVRWIYKGRTMIWITQLCVDKKYRNKGVAKILLQVLRNDADVRGFGILSSHPFALMAVLRIFGRGLEDVNLEMTRIHAKEIMKSCPAGYVQDAQLRGALFGPVEDGTVSCADTKFWVDHDEPLDALRIIKEKGVAWPFGSLPDGHEFLVLVKAKDEGIDRSKEDYKTSEF